MRQRELRDHRSEQAPAHRGRKRQAQPAAHLGGAPRGLGLRIGDQAAGFAEPVGQLLPGLGEAQPPGRAFDQPHAQAPLQRIQPARQH